MCKDCGCLEVKSSVKMAAEHAGSVAAATNAFSGVSVEGNKERCSYNLFVSIPNANSGVPGTKYYFSPVATFLKKKVTGVEILTYYARSSGIDNSGTVGNLESLYKDFIVVLANEKGDIVHKIAAPAIQPSYPDNKGKMPFINTLLRTDKCYIQLTNTPDWGLNGVYLRIYYNC